MTYKIPVLRCVVLLLGGFSVTACVVSPVRPQSSETEQAAPAAQPAAARPTAPGAKVPVQPAAEESAEGKSLTAPLVYDMLLGEIAGQRGQLGVSAASYLNAARVSDDPQIAERALKIAIYSKQPKLALEAAQRWVELAPDDLAARQSLAVLALRTQDEGQALEQFRYLLEHQQDTGTDPYQSVLGLLAREPDQARALRVMEKLVAGHPKDPQAHFAYARLAVHAQKWPLAEQEVGKALLLKPDWTPALILQAQVNLKQGQGDIARKQLESALQRKPKDNELRLAYARLLVDLNDYEGARREYRTLLKAQPDDGQVVYSLALLSLEANKLAEARKLFEKLVKLDVETQQAYYYLGAIAEEEKKPDQAMHWYGKIEEGEHWIEVQIRMARIEAQTGKVSAARERLRKVRLAHPSETQRMYLVEGELLSQVGSEKQAFKLYSDYLENKPDDIEVLYARALVAERLNMLDQAEKDFRAVLKIDPDNARALNALGYTLADRTDRYEEALGYIKRALAQTPDDPAVIDSMGWVLYRMGRLEEAHKYLKRAYDMTKDSEIAAHLGEVLWKMGRRNDAKALWASARKATPGDRVLEETVRRYLP